MQALYFPIEIASRELDFRLALAVRSVSSDTRVLFGQHDELYEVVKRSRGGIYVGKNIFRRLFPLADNLGRYQALRERGSLLVHLDEEGAVFPGSSEEGWARSLDARLDPSVLSPDDYVCAWGAFQADYYRSRASQGGPDIRVTGHPRFDLYKPANRGFYSPELRDIQRKYGPFVLINTNLSSANPRHGPAHVFSSDQLFDGSTAAGRARGVYRWAHEAEKLAHVMRLCHELAVGLSGHRLVVRPHPGEDIELYELAFRGADNVSVVREGSVAPWILAADAMVHTGCTTAIEASIAGTPVVSYRPVPAPAEDPLLPSLFGSEASSLDHALALISAAIEGRDRPGVRRGPIPSRLLCWRILTPTRSAPWTPCLSRPASVLGRGSVRVRGGFVPSPPGDPRTQAQEALCVRRSGTSTACIKLGPSTSPG